MHGGGEGILSFFFLKVMVMIGCVVDLVFLMRSEWLFPYLLVTLFFKHHFHGGKGGYIRDCSRDFLHDGLISC